MRHRWAVVVVLIFAASSFAQEDGVAFFKQKIRPVLAFNGTGAHETDLSI